MEKLVRKSHMITLILLLITIVMVYVVNRLVPFMMDDLWYSTILYSDEPIHNLADIISAQVWHWNNWGGRSMAHGLLQMILLSGEGFADILNTVTVFILSGVCLLAARVSTGKFSNKTAFLLATAGLLIGLNANWKMSMFWESGAANYLYISIFVLLFMLCYLRELGEDPTPLKGIAIWIIPLGIIAGWSNENMGPVCVIISAASMILVRSKGKIIRLWMLIGMVSSLIGSIMCILAPGNFVRNAQIENERGLLWNIFLRCYSECRALFAYQALTLITLTAILIISIEILKISLTDSEKLLLTGAVLSWGAMILSPHYPDRATFGTMCLIITVIISRSILIIQKKKEASVPLYLGFLVIWLKGMYDLFEFVANSFGWIVWNI